MRYDAFISYRHSELDMFVAKRVHRGLETFKVPRAVAKKTGKKKIDRVFRDQEELPIGSDLGDNIEGALRESEFLIVICSPRTPDSYWVQKEISTFIQMHGREHILAILVEGEPDEAFPKLLTMDEKGVPIEPLAADVRGKTNHEVKKKLKTEIMRLAAPLLHCSYDDLRQRHKERFMKKVIAATVGVAVLSMAFGLYNAYNTMMIQKNYEEKQRNQSKYLADLSLSLLEEGDRRTAALIAMEALPTQGNERPYVASAQYALGESLYIYETGNRVGMDYALKHDVPVSDMFFSSDGKKFLTIDQAEYIYVWDVENYTLLSKIAPEFDDNDLVVSVNEAKLNSDDSIIIADQNGIRSVNYDGTLNWQTDSDENSVFALIDTEAGIAVSVATEKVTFYDVNNGNELGSMESEPGILFSGDMAFSKEHDKFVISHLMDLDAEFGLVSVYDFQSKEATRYQVIPSLVLDITFLEDGNFAVAGAMENEIFNIDGNHISKGYVQKLDALSGEQLWMNEFELQFADIEGTTTRIKTRFYIDEETGQQHDEVLMSANRSAYMWDADTGKLMTEMKMTNGIVQFLVNVNNGMSYLLDSTGTINIVDMTNGKNYTTAAVETGKNAMDLCINNGVVAIRSYASPEVTLMKYHEGYGLTEVETLENSIYEMEYSENEEYYSIRTCDQEGNDCYYFYRTENNTNLAEWSPSHSDYASQISGRFISNTFVTICNDGTIDFYDVVQQKQDNLHVTDKLYGLECYFTRNTGLALILGENKYFVVDLKQKKVIASGETDTWFRGGILSEDGKTIYANMREKGICMAEASTGSVKPIDLEGYRMRYVLDSAKSMAISEDGTLFAVNCMDNMLRVLDVNNMTTIAEIPFSATSTCFLAFSEDGKNIFMQGSDYYLRVYNLDTQEFVYHASMQCYEIKSILFDQKAGAICVNTSSGMLLLNEEDYDTIAIIDRGEAYLHSYSRIYCRYGTTLYQFPYMTLDMLLEEAKKQFGDDTLSKQERMQYNVD